MESLDRARECGSSTGNGAAWSGSLSFLFRGREGKAAPPASFSGELLVCTALGKFICSCRCALSPESVGASLEGKQLLVQMFPGHTGRDIEWRGP